MSQLNNENATSERSRDMKDAAIRKNLMSRRLDSNEDSHQSRNHKAPVATEEHLNAEQDAATPSRGRDRI